MDAPLRIARPSLLRRAPRLARQRGRLTAGAVVGGYFALIAALGGYTAWGRLGVPSMPTKSGWWFADLRSVTSAWECARQGVTVLPANTCDPWDRPANYPRLWLLPSHLGLGEGSTFALGLLVSAAFLAGALAVIPAGASAKAGLFYAAALCSPSVMLGIQRGNVDLLIFPLIVLAVLVSRRGLGGLIAANALVLLAGVLKLFPILAVGFLLRRPERAARIGAGAVIGAFLVYVLATRAYIRRIFDAVPQVDGTSFGVRRVSEWVSAVLGDNSSLREWDLVVLGLVVVVVVVARRPLRARLTPPGDDAAAARDLDLFWAGACVYIGSYAAFRSFDYRLVFVLMTVPQLVRWAGAGRWLAVATVVGLFGALWLDTAWAGVPVVGGALSGWDGLTRAGPPGQPLPLAAISQLVLFAGLVGGLLATAPTSLRVRSR